MSLQSVLPSWRFVHSEEMQAESKRFFKQVESMPLYETSERMTKLAASVVKYLPIDYPLIHRADQKCGGVVSEAIIHLGRTRYETRQPGYFYLLGNAFDNLPLQNIDISITNTMRGFIDYVPPKPKKAKAA